MAKTRKKEMIDDHSTLLNAALEDIMGERFGRYSKYIIQDRALPDVRDGLKPVQRRIIYAMYKDHNTWDRPYRKSAKTVGLVIGNYHPHGDSSVYDAMVRLSQGWKVRVPLVDMQGNNGSIDDDPAAAMRYTEARLAPVCADVIADIDYDTVPFAPNYDDNDVEPTVLPSRIPTLLVNGAMGIAAGYATNIPPNNLKEVMDACIYRIMNPTCTIDELMTIIPGPDFPTGGIVMGKTGIENAFKTGRGKIVIRGVANIEEGKTINSIIITEIPYEVVKSQMVKRMDEIRLNHDIDGIIDVRDESDRNGLRVVVDLKKEVDANNVLQYFYKNTPLQVNYNYNVVAIVDRTPRLLSLTDLLDAFIAHRKSIVLKRSRYLLNEREKRCHIIEGLMKAVSILDEVIACIRACKDRSDVIKNLQQQFDFTQNQATAIAELRLYRLSNTDVVALREEFAQLVNEIENLKMIIENENVLRSTIINEFRLTKETYGSPRLTKIEDEVAEINIDARAMIANERVVVSVSRDGYIKRVSLKSFNASTTPYPGLKNNDTLLTYGQADTLDTLILVLDNGSYTYLPIYKIEETKWKDEGNHINHYVKTDGFDHVVAAFTVKDFNTAAYVVTMSANGLIKKTPIPDLSLVRYSKSVTLMKLKPRDRVVYAMVCYDHDTILVATKHGFINRYSLDMINMTAPKGQGIRGIRLAEGDSVVDGAILPDGSTSSYIIINGSNNAVKRVRLSDIVDNKPYVKGTRIAKAIKTNPVWIESITPLEGSDFTMMDEDGFHMIKGSDISIMDIDATYSHYGSIKVDHGLYQELKPVNVIDLSTSEAFQNRGNAIEEDAHSEFNMPSLF